MNFILIPGHTPSPFPYPTLIPLVTLTVHPQRFNWKKSNPFIRIQSASGQNSTKKSVNLSTDPSAPPVSCWVWFYAPSLSPRFVPPSHHCLRAVLPTPYRSVVPSSSLSILRLSLNLRIECTRRYIPILGLLIWVLRFLGDKWHLFMVVDILLHHLFLIYWIVAGDAGGDGGRVGGAAGVQLLPLPEPRLPPRRHHLQGVSGEEEHELILCSVLMCR
jgi:hypothetical protein